MLSATHERQSLATMLAECMAKRYEANIPTAKPDPGYDGIVKTLDAVSSQTCDFEWARITEEIEMKLRKELPGYTFNPDHYRIEPSLLLGAVEAFHKVQSLPEDREITISNKIGAVTLISWAHKILGLHVVVDYHEYRKPTLSVQFPTMFPPQVRINWRYEGAYREHEYPAYPETCGRVAPQVQLLDAEGNVVLKCYPEDSLDGTFEATQDRLEIRAYDRHALKGWGTLFMYRCLNTHSFVDAEDPIHKQLAAHSTALAILTSRNHDRSHQYRDSIAPDLWRILQTSELIFDRIEIKQGDIQNYVQLLETSPENYSLTEKSSEELRASYIDFCHNYSIKFPRGRGDERGSIARIQNGLDDTVKRLAHVVWVASYISNLDECQNLPLIMNKQDRGLRYMRVSDEDYYIGERDTFRAVLALFSTDESLSSKIDRTFSDEENISTSRNKAWLVSDCGWSVYIDTADDKDPVDTSPTLVYVKPGVPTYTSSGERRKLVSDGPLASTGPEGGQLPPSGIPLIRDGSCRFQQSAKIRKRQQFWTRSADDFQMTLRYNLCHVPYRGEPGLPPQKIKEIDLLNADLLHCRNVWDYSGYHEALEMRMEALPTPEDICTHGPISIDPDQKQTFRIRPDTGVAGLNNLQNCANPPEEKVVVQLTIGDRRLRWLALKQCNRRNIEGDQSRHILLRHPRVCPDCSLDYALTLTGKWTLIL